MLSNAVDLNQFISLHSFYLKNGYLGLPLRQVAD